MRSTAHRFRTRDVIYSRLRPYLNKVWRADRDGLCSSEFIVLPENDQIDADFLRYRLNSPDFVSIATHLNTGDRPRVDYDQISEFETWLPASLHNQRQIVAEIEKQFTRLEVGVAGLRRVQPNLKRYRAAVLKAACEGKLVPTEAELARQEGRTYESGAQLLERILSERRETWTGKGKYKGPTKQDTANLHQLSDGWICSTLGQVFDVYVGATPSRQRGDFWNGKIPWVSSGEVSFCRIRETRERITELGLANSSTEIHPPGTVLIGMIGEGRTRGQVAILDVAACNNQNSAAIRVSEVRLPPEYTYSFLMSQYEQNRKLGSGNNQPALNKARVQNIPFPLPPLSEQQRIVAELDRRLSVVEDLEAVVNANLQRGTRLRQSILQRAFEGKLLDLRDRLSILSSDDSMGRPSMSAVNQRTGGDIDAD